MINNIEFWQSLSSRRKTFVFKDRHIQETNIQALFDSDNAIFVRLDYWNKTLQALDVVQVVNIITSNEVDLAARQVERDIDIEQLDFL